MFPFSPQQNQLLGHRASSIALVLANIWPLVGVAALGWSAFEVVFVYWCENVILGVINIFKMLSCSPRLEEIDDSVFEKLIASPKNGSSSTRAGAQNTALSAEDSAEYKAQALAKMKSQMAGSGWMMQAMKVFFVPFFSVHYGGFCFGHGVFIFALLGANGPFQKSVNNTAVTAGGSPLEVVANGAHVLQEPWLLLSIVLLAGSHLFSFVKEYLIGGEYRRTILPTLMMQPYARIVILHVAILAGGVFAAFLGSPVWTLVPLVIGKTMLDLKLHLREHQKLEASPANR